MKSFNITGNYTMSSDLGEAQLNRIYDDFQGEQMKLMTQLKNGDDLEAAKDIQKQLSFLNTITMAILRFRNLRKKKYSD